MKGGSVMVMNFEQHEKVIRPQLNSKMMNKCQIYGVKFKLGAMGNSILTGGKQTGEQTSKWKEEGAVGWTLNR